MLTPQSPLMKYRALIVFTATLLLHQPLAAQKKWPEKLRQSHDAHKKWVQENRPKSLFGQKIQPGEWPENWPLIYANVSARIAPLYGASISLASIIGKHHEISAGFTGYLQESPDYPPDFKCGFCKHGLGNEGIYGVAVNYGYVLYPHFRPGIFRFVLRAGVMLGQQGTINNFQPVTNPGPNDDNYTFTNDYRPASALQLHPTLDIALGRNPGISIGPYALFSRDFNGGGLTLGMLLGRVGNVNLRPWWKSRRPEKGSDLREPVSQN
jgi:hypothetical protein